MAILSEDKFLADKSQDESCESGKEFMTRQAKRMEEV